MAEDKPNVGTPGHVDYMCSGSIPKSQMVLITGVSGYQGKSLIRTLEKEGFYTLEVDVDEFEQVVREEFGLLEGLQSLEMCANMVIDALTEVEVEPKPEPPYYERFRNAKAGKK